VKHPTRWLALTVAVIVLAFAVVLATQVGSDPQAESKTSALVGDPVPEFSVQTLEGEALTEADLAGRAVIVNFWNSWCIPCHQELPALKAFYKAHADETDFMMLGIVRDDTEDAVREYVADEELGWVIGLDPGSKATLAFGTRGQPETFALTPDGQVVAFQFGPSSEAILDRMLAEARR
jgi:cytochrome c biogenesis protein CcmG/thiol:disulfide interchange protein DsbE